VTAYVQLLAQRTQGQLDVQAQEFMGYAVEGAQRMKALIEDLLAYSRMGIRGKPLTLRTVPPSCTRPCRSSRCR
jgi:light-regulated signal transduction histidine kinase (bacteriophytochrome)